MRCMRAVLFWQKTEQAMRSRAAWKRFVGRLPKKLWRNYKKRLAKTKSLLYNNNS